MRARVKETSVAALVGMEFLRALVFVCLVAVVLGVLASVAGVTTQAGEGGASTAGVMSSI